MTIGKIRLGNSITYNHILVSSARRGCCLIGVWASVINGHWKPGRRLPLWMTMAAACLPRRFIEKSEKEYLKTSEQSLKKLFVTHTSLRESYSICWDFQ